MLGRFCQAQRGATMLEILITLLILSIGLLGMAGLQALSLKSNQSAYYRSQATFLAYDISERMRANSEVARAGGYVVESPTSLSTYNTESTDLAARDIAEWLNNLAETLPSGTGKNTLDGTLVTIEVSWDDTRGAIQAPSSEEAKILETFVYRTEI
ncbi:MAG TPA: type IV pilus modification protein PilV [Thiopseudomonas sp.]|nr:type IV pilus modification protein PilV [Thiopseudomonas sp.]